MKQNGMKKLILASIVFMELSGCATYGPGVNDGSSGAVFTHYGCIKVPRNFAEARRTPCGDIKTERAQVDWNQGALQ